MAGQGHRRDPEGWANAGLLYEVVDGVAWLRMNRPERRQCDGPLPRRRWPRWDGPA